MRKIQLRQFLPIIAMILLLFLIGACSAGKQNASSVTPAQSETISSQDSSSIAQLQQNQALRAGAPEPSSSGVILVAFRYERQSGAASNQYAVWVEDESAQLIKTLYVTKWTAGGGYKSRPDSIALWVEKSGLASMSANEVDAVSGPTPAAGVQSYTWDLTGADGEAVPPGTYTVFVEGTLRWKNRVIYSGVIHIDDAGKVTPPEQTEANFSYEASDRSTALTEDSPETKMISEVAVHFIHDPGN